jgi:hypothetical protein
VSVLSYTLRYVNNGWSVVPIVPGTKAPPAGFPLAAYLSGATRMTADDAREWWTAHPDHGVAIICGPPSGNLLVVDVDVRNGGNIEEVRRDCPSPCFVETGSGGLHLYTVSAGEVAKGKTERAGVDRQARGSYVLAPPTLHPITGKPYVWKGLGAPLAELPAWVLRTPAPAPGENGDGAHWIADTLAHPEGVLPGTQHETLVKLAWWLSAQPLPEDIAGSILFGFASRLPLSREPWTAGQTNELLRSAYQKRGQTASFATTLAGVATAPQQAATDARAACLSKIRNRMKTGVSWEVASVHTDWLVENIAAPSCFTEVVGEVKKGKTTFIAQLVRSVLLGEEFLGFPVKQGPVVLYTEQEGLSLHHTLERAGIRRHPDLHWITQSDVIGEPWAYIGEGLIAACREFGASILIVDTLAQLAGLAGESENASGSVSVLQPFQYAKEHGIACVFVRHASKSVENRGNISRAGRGTTAITGAMDICVLHEQPGSEDIRTLKVVSRLREEATWTLKYEEGLYVVMKDGAPPVGAAKVTAQNRAKVEDAWKAGARTADEIAKITGLHRNTVRRHLDHFLGSMSLPPEALGEQGEKPEETEA